MKPRHSSNAGSEEIMAEIAETRAHMDDTLDQLSARLQPRHILDDILDYFRSRRRSSGNGRHRLRSAASKTAGHVKETAGQVTGQVKEKASNAGRIAYEQVRQHPLPAVLIGAGITMLLMERNRGTEYDEIYDSENEMAGDLESGFAEMEFPEGVGPESYALPHHYTGDADSGDGPMSKLKNKSSQLKQKAGASLQNMKERTSEKTAALRRRASERGAQLKEKARHGYEQGYESFKQTAEERPLAVGLGFLAIGVVAGMLLPSTRKEDELVGPTRDRLVNRSREVAEDAVDRGKQVARTAYDVAAREAREQGLTPEALKEKTKAVASQVKEATRDDAQRQQREFTQELKQS